MYNMKKSLLLSFAFMLLFGVVFSQNNNTSDSPAFQCGSTFSDVDGNIYQTVYVAGYCWMKSNLKVAHYAGDASAISRAMVYRSPLHPNEIENDSIFGRLYTWYSAVNVPENSAVSPAMDEEGYVRGACPAGWHIPTAEEMSALRQLSANSLRSTEHWLHPENNTNSSGYTALPAGTYNAALNRYENLLDRTGFWSVDGGTMIGEGLDATYLYYYCEDPMTSMTPKADGLSVRCVLGGASGDAIVPTLSPSCNVGDVNPTSATATCEVTSDGGASVTARGVCWGTSSGPTLADSHTSNGVGIGAFSCSMTGLTPNTTYYVRPYAVNGAGTAYGEEVTFTTPCWAVEVTISGATNLCEGETATLTASGAQTYAWNTGVNSAAITVNTSGTYTVTGYDGYHCPGTASKTVTVTSCATIPTVTVSVDGNSVTHSSATVTGEVTSDGGSPITGYGFCWGTGTDPDITGTHSTNVPGAGGFTGSFSETLTGLLPNTTYCVRSYATNSEGTSYGTAVCFTTPCWAVNVSITGETSICTGESTTLTASGANTYQWTKGTSTTVIGTDATLNVSTSGTYHVTGYDSYHCPGTANKTVTVHVPQHGSVTVSVCPSDLPYSWHGTEYPETGDYTYAHTDNDGCLQVDTLHLVLANCAVAPTVTVNVEDGGVGSTSATVNGNVTSDGGAPITGYGFCWGTSADPDITGTHSTNVPGTGGFSGGFTETLTGLSPNTTYYVRSYATNSQGTSYGTTVWFTTSCWTVDVAITGETSICSGETTTLTASGANTYQWTKGTSTTVIGTDATLTVSTSGTYYVNGYDGYHCPGTESKTVTVHVPQHGSVTESVCPSELPYSWHGTEYPQAGDYTYAHTDNDGCLQVDTLHLVLENCAQDPTVTTNAATSITETAAILNGIIVNPDNVAITAKGFEWKATEGGTYAAVDVTGEAMTYDLASLTPNTGYTYKAFITYGGNTVYGDEVTFTTPCWTVNVTILGESEMCEGASTTLTASGASTYEWRKGTTTSDIIGTDATFAVSTSGTYYVKGYDGYHCPGTASKTVTVHGGTHYVEEVRACNSYVWHGTTYINSGVYTYPYVNAHGCASVDTLNLTVISCVTLPTVTTSSVSYITSTTATLKGTISNPDNITISALGFEWKASVGGTYTQLDGSCSGNNITASLNELSPYTSYTYRAFISYDGHIVYGNEKTFNTLGVPTVVSSKPCTVSSNHPAQAAPMYMGNGYNGANNGLETETSDGSLNSVTDYEGNEYPVVQIGSQCWLAENMRCTHSPSTGTRIAFKTNSTTSIPYTYSGKVARWYYNDSVTAINNHDGLLYNWNAAVDVYNAAYGEVSVQTNSDRAVNMVFSGNRQGICPKGWHVPSNNDWTILSDYVNSQDEYKCDNSNGRTAKSLASKTGWNYSQNFCSVGNTPSMNNATGFDARPSGDCTNGFYGKGNLTYIWSSTQSSSNEGNFFYLNFSDAVIHNSGNAKYYCCSVRCLRDENASPVITPTVTTGNASSVTVVSAILSATITNPDNFTITAKGFEWKETDDDVYSQVISEGVGNSFASNVNGLHSNTNYTYRAFITYGSTTVYSDEATFSTIPASVPVGDAQPCPGAATVTDVDQNTYNTVQIGTQCWMAENLRTRHYANGTLISYGGTSSSSTVGYYYNYSSSGIALESRGYLYNWAAVMHGAVSSNTNPSSVLGVCPIGWHVPSDAEWTVLVDYLNSKNAYCCDNNSENIAKALADDSGWNSSTNDCALGNGQGTNVSGFAAVPTGYFSGSSFYSVGIYAYFWSSSQSESNANASRDYYLYYNRADINRTYHNKENGYSVRCVRDIPISLLTHPTVTTSAATDVAEISSTIAATFSNPDNVTIAAKGFEWKVSGSDNYTSVDVMGELLSYDLIGLIPGTSYTYRAFVTYNDTTAYGEEMTFTTNPASTLTSVVSEKPCNPATHLPQTGTTYHGNGYNGANHGLETVNEDGKINSVTDYEGNEYPVVQIGSQCWLAENMRCTHSPKTGRYIISAYRSFRAKSAAWYDNDSVMCVSKNYGLLYNWCAAIDTNSGYTEVATENQLFSQHWWFCTITKARQGICPKGWHVPSDSEWTTMESAASGTTISATSTGWRGTYAGKLASGDDWTVSSTVGAPGYYSNTLRNSSGFSAVPAGSRNATTGSFSEPSSYTCFWTTSEYSSECTYYRSISYSNVGVYRNYTSKTGTFSVRCVRN